MVGYVASTADVTVADEVKSAPDATKYPHLARWCTHIASYSPQERCAFAETELPSALTASAGSAVNGSAKKPSAKDDDDDFDMFGSDESEDEDAQAEKVQ